MNKDIVRNALICISKMKIEDTTHCVARDIILEEYENQQNEIERLNIIIKTKDKGIKAFTEDLCDTTKELEKANKKIEKLQKELDYSNNDNIYYIAKIDKAIEFIENDNTIVGKDINGELYAYELKILNILKGEDND